MPADLVGGSYHVYDPVWTAIGRLANAKQPNIAARTNLHWHGLQVAEKVLVTGKQQIAAVPVEWGDIISKISVPIAATEGEAASETFVCLYEGVEASKKAKLLSQGKSVTAAVKKEKLFTQALEKEIEITSTNAPNGYIYAGICSTATTMAVIANVAIKPKALNITGAPAFGVVEADKAATEAAAEITATPVEFVPVVILT